MKHLNRNSIPIRGTSMGLYVCGNPRCGSHLVINDEQDKPLCEVVLSQEATKGLIKNLSGVLYGKAVGQDD